MKHWFNTHYKTLIIAAFLIPIITVAIVSISHVTKWYGISNPVTWAVYLSIGIEIAALSALAAISANMGKKVYFPFAIVTVVQFIGNIYFAYSFIDVNTKSFQDWVGLVSPLVEFMGVDPNDFSGHKRFLAFFAGGMLPLISLSFLHMLVQFTEEDRMNEVIEEVDEKLINKVDAKDIVSEVSKLRLSEDDLAILEKHLLNPQPPTETLVKAAQRYSDEVREKHTHINDFMTDEDILSRAQEIQMKKTFERMEQIEKIREEKHGPILPEDEPVGALANSGIREKEWREEYEKEIEMEEEWGGLTNEELIGDDEITTTNQVDEEKTQLQKLEEYVNPTQEEEIIFHQEPTIEEESENFSTIEPITENIFQDNEYIPSLSDEEIMEMNQDEHERIFQEDVISQDPLDSFSDEFITQAIEEFNQESIKDEMEEFKVDVQEINNTLEEVNQIIDNPPVEETPLPLEMTSILPQPQVEDEKKNSKSLI